MHIGQEDMAPAEARRILGPERLLGVSTHNVEQLRAALKTGAADYLAIGPVFATGSKDNPDPVVGMEGVKAARALTRLPLVAIGGITGGERARGDRGGRGCGCGDFGTAAAGGPGRWRKGFGTFSHFSGRTDCQMIEAGHTIQARRCISENA